MADTVRFSVVLRSSGSDQGRRSCAFSERFKFRESWNQSTARTESGHSSWLIFVSAAVSHGWWSFEKPLHVEFSSQRLENLARGGFPILIVESRKSEERMFTAGCSPSWSGAAQV